MATKTWTSSSAPRLLGVDHLGAGEPLLGPGQEPLPPVAHPTRAGREVLPGDDQEALPLAVGGRTYRAGVLLRGDEHPAGIVFGGNHGGYDEFPAWLQPGEQQRAVEDGVVRRDHHISRADRRSALGAHPARRTLVEPDRSAVLEDSAPPHG
ncbi:MAG: hypothetical protein ACR2JG_10950 [Geodermatophilaceae bacterium]